MMPLPDANKKSPRVYTNLQNLDLDNVTFANIQATGNPIAVEELNEDEMRRLVLVNLARLVTAGEWDGLLSAGGGEYNVELPPYSATAYAADYIANVATAPPYGSSTVQGGSITTDMEAWPFVSPNTGNVSEMFVGVNSGVTNTISMCIYSDNNGTPLTLLGYGDFDISSTGLLSQTSLSATISLTRGTQYWYAMKSSTTNQPNMKKVNVDYNASLGLGDTLSMTSTTGKYMSINTEVAFGDALPASITLSNCTVGNFSARPMFGLKF